MFVNRVRINTFALAARLPTMYAVREYVEAGGLMSYGPNWPGMWRRAAELADKILRGAKPAGLPVEQPTKFDLVGRFHGSNRMPTKIGPSGCSCEMPVNEEAMMAADMIGFMESVV